VRNPSVVRRVLASRLCASRLLAALCVVPALIALLATIGTVSAPARAEGIPFRVASAVAGPPQSIAAAGDSFNTGFAALPHSGDHPALSWSTGSDPSVLSLYDRLLPLAPSLRGHAKLVAVDGTKIESLPAQFARAAAFHAQLVTVQSGGNDVCDARDPDALTPPASFRASVEQAFAIARSKMPDARIFITSLTDEARWNDESATIPGNAAKLSDGTLCDPQISGGVASRARRAQIQQAELRYNAILRQVCASDALCRYDDGAFFRLRYSRQDIAATNAFHPSVAGLRRLAATAWQAGFDFTDVEPPQVSATVVRTGTALRVSLRASDNRGVAGIECRAADGTFARCGGTQVVAQGTQLVFRAVDRNGNISATYAIAA
jgi:hypothetical protein